MDKGAHAPVGQAPLHVPNIRGFLSPPSSDSAATHVPLDKSTPACQASDLLLLAYVDFTLQSV